MLKSSGQVKKDGRTGQLCSRTAYVGHCKVRLTILAWSWTLEQIRKENTSILPMWHRVNGQVIMWSRESFPYFVLFTACHISMLQRMRVYIHIVFDASCSVTIWVSFIARKSRESTKNEKSKSNR